MDRKAAAKSQALQYEVELNEAVASAPKAAAAGAPPDGSVVAKCCAILDDMERESLIALFNFLEAQCRGSGRRALRQTGGAGRCGLMMAGQYGRPCTEDY
jgi:hypothetical protein